MFIDKDNIVKDLSKVKFKIVNEKDGKMLIITNKS